MCLNIFPQGNTAIHKLFHEEDYIKRFYEVSRKDVAKGQRVGKISIPFIRNFKGMSPMHFCLQNNNYQSMNCLLESIALDRIDNHIRAFSDIFPKILATEIPTVEAYLSSRVLQLSPH